MKPRVLVYHTALSKNPTPDDLDVLSQSKFVSGILNRLGYKVEQKPFEIIFSEEKKYFDAGKVKQEIKRAKPSFIFNLVESIENKDSLAFLAPFIFENNSVPYTGCTGDSFFRTRNKIETKKILEKNNILTPYWITLKDLDKKSVKKKKFLIKFNIAHASKNIGNVLLKNKKDIEKELKSKGDDFFAEEYIEGREFNISMIGSVGNGKILPIPEMKFVDWPKEKLKIVGYSAKWDSDSLEYNNTKRFFDFPNSDKKLLRELEKTCKKCWNLFGLRGYARVDIRVRKNKIYILEVNQNPCISPDAGFIAAVHQAGMTDEQVIREIIKYSCGEEFVL